MCLAKSLDTPSMSHAANYTWLVIPGSSTDISEDWEKDFDLDMTEEEVQMALSKVDASGELEDVEWEDWE